MLSLKPHPTNIELADFLSGCLPAGKRREVEGHIASCDECLEKAVLAYEAVRLSGNTKKPKKGILKFMRKINIYLILAIVSFLLSFLTPRYFIQSLVAALILGIKWVVDSKTTKMLIMIHEAWKRGGERDVSRILQDIDSESLNRL
jgi:hypothetical protein